MTTRTFDLVVVGAGVAGAAIAARAAELGASVAVVDAGLSGGATAAGAGIISNHGLDDAEQDPAWLSLVHAGTAEYGRLMRGLGDEAEPRSGYRIVGEVVLAVGEADQAAITRLRGALEALPSAPDRPETALLAGADLRRLWPPIAPDAQGLFLSTTARVDGGRLARLLLDHARRHRAVVERGRARFEDGTGRRVSLGGDVLEAGEVVVAAGAWSPTVLEPTGVRLSVTADRGQIVHLAGDPGVERAPVLKSFDGSYVLGFPGPRVVVGATHDTGSPPEPQVRAGDQHAILERAFAVAPGLRARTVLETRVGFRPASDDGLPLVGRLGDGLSVLTGLGSWGLTLGPLLGRRVADGLLGTGDGVGPDLAFLSPWRPGAGTAAPGRA